nr:ribonuclease H-like domain-containing protein [Tanacetum cinerariifolium]
MDSDTAHMMAASKVPMLKLGVTTFMPITSVEDKAQRWLEVKDRRTLMMGIPNEHQLKFNSIKDAKQLIEAIEKRFGVMIEMPITTAEEKAQKRLEMKPKSTLMMGIPNEHQLKFNSIKDAKKLLEALELLVEKLSQEDVNQKLLRSLSPEWNTHVVAWRNKANLDTMSMDDLYNNLKVYEPEVKEMSNSSSSIQNMAFVSSSNNNTSSTNGAINTAHEVSTASTQVNTAYFVNNDNLSDAVICLFFASQPNINTAQAVNTAIGVSTAGTQVNTDNIDNLSDAVICAFLASQLSSPQLVNKDLEQIHPDDLEIMDLRWQMTMLTIRARRILKKTGRKLTVNGNETIRFDKTNVECYNCHKKGHFAKECRAPRSQDTKHKESTRRTVPMETPTLTTLIVDNCKKRLGFENYNAVLPPYIVNCVPPIPDLSITGLDEFANMHVVENCNAKTSETKPKDVWKNNDALIIKEWVLDDEDTEMIQPKFEQKTVKPSIPKIEFSKPKQPDKKARKTDNPQKDLQDKEVIDSGCSRYMTGNMSYLTDYKEIDEGYVAFGGIPKGGKIIGKGTIRTGNFIPPTPDLSFTSLDEFVNKPAVENCKAKLIDEQTDEELTENDIKRMYADDQAIQTILLGLLEDIYAAVDSCETAKEIWERVRQMMKGSDIGKQEKKAKLFNEWEKFTSTNGELIESYYHHFMKLMNDLKRNKHFPENIASNLKFLNNLQPEWKRHVTIVRQTKNLHEADFTPIYDFLKMNQDENGGIQVTQNAVQNAGVQSGGYWNWESSQTQLLIAQKEEAWIQIQAEEFDFMAAVDLFQVYKVEKALYGLHQAPRASFLKVKNASTPMETQKPLLKDKDGKEVDVHMYRSMIGSLMYLTYSRPDIMFAVCACARYQGNPKVSHLHAVKRIFREVQLQTLVDGEKTKRKDTELPQTSGPTTNIAYEVVNEEMDDSLVRAATTASSLEAEQTVTKTTQALKIDSLKKRVKKLKKKQRSRTHKLKRLYKVGLTARVESSNDETSLGEDASKQERIIDIDADEGITLVSTHDDAEIYFHEPEESTTTATATIPKSKSQDMGKAIMIEELVKLKKKDQIQIDEEVALKLQAELQDDIDKEQRFTRKKAQKEEVEASIALIETWNDVQAKIDADYQLAKRRQVKEQQALNDEEKATLFMQLLEKRRKFFAAKRVEEKRNKPPTEAQQRKIMCTYLKNVEGKKLTDLKNKSFDSIQKMFDKAFKRVNTFVDYKAEMVEESSKKDEAEVMNFFLKRVGTKLEQESSKKQKIDDDKETTDLKQLVKIIPDEEGVAIGAIYLVVNSPSIVDRKIHKVGKKTYY